MRRSNKSPKMTDSERAAYIDFVGGREYTGMGETEFVLRLRRDAAERKAAAKANRKLWGNVPSHSHIGQDVADFLGNARGQELEMESTGNGGPLCGSRSAYVFSQNHGEFGDTYAEHGLCVRPEPTVVRIFKYDEEADDDLLVREITIEDDEDEEADEMESRRQVIDGKITYHGAGVVAIRRGQPVYEEVATGVRSRGGKWNNVDGLKPKIKKASPQPANQPKKRFEYTCTEPGCGKVFTCKSKLRTDADSAPIRCESCRKARPIHPHLLEKKSAQS